jgi:myo-inositol-1(or 4)-monophosphatase
MKWDEFVGALGKAANVGLQKLQQSGGERREQSRVVETHEETSATRQIDLTIQEAVLSVLTDLPVEIISEEESEERKERPTDFFVVLDPIDGTTNFDHGIPFYAISIAAGRKSDDGPKIGDIEFAIILTVSGDCFMAQKNKGASVNGSLIQTSQVNELEKAIIRPTSEFTKRDLALDKKFDSYLYLGSTAIELAMLARGAVDIFVETKKRKVFDFAAAYLIAKEAGAVITDLQGNDLDKEYVNKKTRSTLIIAANEKLHGEILKIYR